ncbi:MAG TPA: cellulose synthase complex periplasmic endoglucanase BcsZ [Terracidiphilus sp.]|jgi:endoglucanase
MRLKSILTLCLISIIPASSNAQDWPSLWKSYISGFVDNQMRVIDHDAGDRTTSEGQAYGMFFALVANDRSHFDGLLRWTEHNLGAGDLSANLPAWLWGHDQNNQWGVLDKNSASDADIWMAYTLLEAGKAWNEPRYTKIGTALARNIAAQEVANVPGLGTTVLPGPTGFQHGNSYRVNASYVPLQLVLGLNHFVPDGPWQKVAASIPLLVSDSAPHGFVSDWTEFKTGTGLQAVPTIGSYDAIRVYLWAGMLDKSTKDRDALLKSLSGMANYLRTNAIPPAKVRPDGTIEDAKGPVGFSAALLPFAMTLNDDQFRNQQMSRVQSELKPQTGLFGAPARYYDQNLALFGLGFLDQQFSFDPTGQLRLKWK